MWRGTGSKIIMQPLHKIETVTRTQQGKLHGARALSLNTTGRDTQKRKVLDHPFWSGPSSKTTGRGQWAHITRGRGTESWYQVAGHWARIWEHFWKANFIYYENTSKIVFSLSKPQLLTRRLLNLRPDIEVLSRTKLILIQHIVWKTSIHGE